VARQLADCGIPIVGVVLVDPDPRDRSDGTLWDGLHTALRGRTGRTAIEAAEATVAAVAERERQPETKPAAKPEPELEPKREPVLVTTPAPILEPSLAARPQPAPVPYPAPVPANGVNGANGTANGNGGNGNDLPTTRFATVAPHPANGADHATKSTDRVDDPPTKRFPPLRPEDVEELARRRTQS
jgi:hypothetical protein